MINFKRVFSIFFLLTIIYLQNSTSLTAAHSKELTISTEYQTPELPKQDNPYSSKKETPSITNLWGYWCSNIQNPHQEIERIINEGQVKSACALAPTEISNPKITTTAPNFIEILSSVTNENCQNLRTMTQKQERIVFKALEQHRKELFALVSIISLEIKAHDQHTLTRDRLDKTKTLFKEAIDECIKNEQETLATILSEYNARITALTKIQNLLV